MTKYCIKDLVVKDKYLACLRKDKKYLKEIKFCKKKIVDLHFLLFQCFIIYETQFCNLFKLTDIKNRSV